jgi:hypothetical protein
MSNWDSENVYAPSLVVIQSEQDPVLMINNRNFLHIVKDVSWIQDVRLGKEPDFLGEISKILPSCSGKVGLVGLDDFPYESYQALQRVLPARADDGHTCELARTRTTSRSIRR